MPMWRRTVTGSTSEAYIFSPWYNTSPDTTAPGTRSFMRLRQRIRVLFPQPDGPIMAVISRGRISMRTSLRANASPYLTLRSRTEKTCLLYTSDAADDLLCVDLGGRRIIKKKKKKKKDVCYKI